MVIDITLAILTTSLGFLSIAGNTWDDDVGSNLFQKLTGRGWASIVCLLAIFGLGLISYFNNNKEKRELKQLAIKAAYEEINASSLAGLGAGSSLQSIINKFGPPSMQISKLDGCRFGKNASIYHWGNNNYSISAIVNEKGVVQAFTIFPLSESCQPLKIFKHSDWAIGFSSYEDIRITPDSSRRDIIDFGRHKMYWEYFAGNRSELYGDFIVSSYLGIDMMNANVDTFDRRKSRPGYLTSFNIQPSFLDYRNDIHSHEWFEFVKYQTLDEGF